MKKNIILILVFAVLVLIPLTLSYLEMSQTRIYCDDKSEGCIEKTIREIISTTKLTLGELKDVTMIADDDNLIYKPFTKLEYEVEELHFDMEEDNITNYTLKAPWDLEFLPDDTMLVTTKRAGEVFHIDDDKINRIYKFPEEFYNESSNYRKDENSLIQGGVLGLAIDPAFQYNNYIYIYHTYAEKGKPAFITSNKTNFERILNRISRFTFNGTALINEIILIDNIPGSKDHSGGRLEFGPDNKLYATTGDAEALHLAADPDFPGGKVLRLNTDGTIPEDNPFNNSYAYSVGHRNPQGLAWHPETKDLYTSEHGTTRRDEINRIVPGANYGWGLYLCDKKHRSWWEKSNTRRFDTKKDLFSIEETRLPIYCEKDWTMAPSGMVFVDDPKSPWYKSLFIANLRGKHLHRLAFDGDSVAIDEIFYINNGYKRARLRDVEFHKGSLYVISSNRGGPYKITPKQSTDSYHKENLIETEEITIAKCLTRKGMVMYGIEECRDCQGMKRLFKEGFKHIKYIECTGNMDICKSNAISTVPAFIFADNTRLEGPQPLNKLAKKADC